MIDLTDTQYKSIRETSELLGDYAPDELVEMVKRYESLKVDMRTIAVDFDGVIHRYKNGWQGRDVFEPPMDGALEVINKLVGNGYEVYILTARVPEDWQLVKDWLKKYGFPDLEVTNVKRPALSYIDDKAMRFTNWRDVKNYYL